MTKEDKQLLEDLETLYQLRSAYEKYTKLETSVKERMKKRHPGIYALGSFSVTVAQRKGRPSFNPPETWTKKYDKLMFEREQYAVEGEPVTVITWSRDA